jgi:DNA-3-methyladenine glycosylase II
MPWKKEIDKAVAHLHQHDVRLAHVIDQYSRPSFQPHTDYYRELIESIISQQLSVKAAASIYGRFIESFDEFPTPKDILERDVSELRGVGLSGQKASYIKDLASKVLDGEVRFDHLNSLGNDEIVAELTAVKGIGEWTAHMFLIFCMGRLDVLPVGDLGIKNAVTRLYNLPSPVTPEAMRHVAKSNAWHPYESIASWYLWQSLENK